MRSSLLGHGIDHWILGALLGWPLVAAVLVRLLGRDAIGPATDLDDEAVPVDVASGTALDARVLTLVALVIEAVLGLLAWACFDPAADGWQLELRQPWLPDLGAALHLGVDGIALPMLVLTTLVMPLALAATWRQVTTRTATYGALLLALTAGAVGIFTALDLLLFYMAWELLLIPMYFVIGIWGGEGRGRAAIQYVLLTLCGSLLMLVAIGVLYVETGSASFALDALARHGFGLTAQLWLFGAFFAAFAIKSAMVPFHSWLPAAQAAAPTFGAVVLGFKVGTYALLRFTLPLFPAAVTHDGLRTAGLVVAVVSILYGALAALAQRDLRGVLSYASVSHLGFILLGIFALTEDGVQGALLVMLNHGIATSALFLLAGALRERTGTDAFAALGGLAKALPLFSLALMVAMMATIALPGLSGFVGEFLVLVGAFDVAPAPAIAATLGVILAAAYALRALMAVLFGTPAEPAAGDALTAARRPAWRDLGPRETLVLGAFALGMVTLGLAPQVVLTRSAPAVRQLIATARDAAAVPPVPSVPSAAETAVPAPGTTRSPAPATAGATAGSSVAVRPEAVR